MNITTLTRYIETRDRKNQGNLIGRIVRLVERFNPADDVEEKRFHPDDLTVASHSKDAAKDVDELIARLYRRISDLERLAETDELTGLLNRRGFNKQMHRVLANASRYDEQGVLVYIDLDDFKPVNDTYGHAAGDEVLRQVARQLRQGLRDTDSVGRLGGDEFAVLLTRTTWENGLIRAEKINQTLNETTVPWMGGAISVAASLGMQGYKALDEEADLLNRADEAMYKTKRLRCQLRARGSEKRQAAM